MTRFASTIVAVLLLGLTTSLTEANYFMMCTPNEKPTSDPALCKEKTAEVMEMIGDCTGSTAVSSKFEVAETERRNLRMEERQLSHDPCAHLNLGSPIGQLLACCLVGSYSYCSAIISKRRELQAVTPDEALEALSNSLPATNNKCSAMYKAKAAQADHDCFGTPTEAECFGFYATV